MLRSSPAPPASSSRRCSVAACRCRKRWLSPFFAKKGDSHLWRPWLQVPYASMDKRHQDDTRERIQTYLERRGLSSANPRVVPLTPDASDRRYFRLLLPDAPSIVLSLYAAPFNVTTLPFVNVATLMARMPVPIPAVLGHADDIGLLALQDLGDVTLQAHLGAASPAQHPALYRQSVALIATLQKRGAGARVAGVPAVRHFVRRRKADLGARLLHQALPRGLPRRDARRRRAGGAAPGIRRHRPGTGGRAARAVPSRLPQPQPDALRRTALPDRLPGRAHGARYLRPGLAAARLLPRSERPDGRRADRLLPRAEGHAPRTPDFRRRFDVMALQRNLKALGTFGYQTTARRNPVYIQYMPRTLRYVRRNLALPALRPTPRFAGDLTSRNSDERIPHPESPIGRDSSGRCTMSGSCNALRHLNASLSRAAAQPRTPGADCCARVRGGRSLRDAEPFRLSRPGRHRGPRRLAERHRAGAARHPRADRRSPRPRRSVGRGDLERRRRQREAAGGGAGSGGGAGRRADHSGRRVRRPPRHADGAGGGETTARRGAAQRRGDLPAGGAARRQASRSR